MKLNLKIPSLILVGICLIVSQLSACTSTNRSAPDANIYWYEDPQGVANHSSSGLTYSPSIRTNDIARLQKLIPYTLIFPKYFPDRLNSYTFFMTYTYQATYTISIEYYCSGNKKYIRIEENQASDSFLNTPLPTEISSVMYPGYSPVMIDLTQLWEREENGYVMPKFTYRWVKDNVNCSTDIYGYDHNVARKIIESMIK
jgi:hypothetical protein